MLILSQYHIFESYKINIYRVFARLEGLQTEENKNIHQSSPTDGPLSLEKKRQEEISWIAFPV